MARISLGASRHSTVNAVQGRSKPPLHLSFDPLSPAPIEPLVVSLLSGFSPVKSTLYLAFVSSLSLSQSSVLSYSLPYSLSSTSSMSARGLLSRSRATFLVTLIPTYFRYPPQLPAIRMVLVSNVPFFEIYPLPNLAARVRAKGGLNPFFFRLYPYPLYVCRSFFFSSNSVVLSNSFRSSAPSRASDYNFGIRVSLFPLEPGWAPWFYIIKQPGLCRRPPYILLKQYTLSLQTRSSPFILDFIENQKPVRHSRVM